MLNLIASLDIPTGSGLGALINGLLRWVYTIVGNYGMAVILFTLLIRIILLPLDYFNKFLTKRNAAKMAEFKEEDAALKKQFASNPMAYMSARREMYRRNGYKPMGSSLFVIVNMVVTLFVFFTVLSCLGSISTTNLNRQYQKLGEVYVEYRQDANLEVGSDEFKAKLEAVYKEYNSSFLWIHNIFRPDTWVRKTPTQAEFNNAINNKDFDILSFMNEATDQEKNEYRTEMYKSVFTENLEKTKTGWNGYFLLIILAAVTTYFSTVVNMKSIQKKKDTESLKEVEVGYSIRKAKESADPAIPQIDPAAMAKVMKYILPAVMVIVTFSSTAAFALYIVAGSIIQTSFGLGTNAIIDKIMARSEQIKKDAAPKHPVINPHTRYFKKK